MKRGAVQSDGNVLPLDRLSEALQANAAPDG